MKSRDTLWLLAFCGFGVNYMLRININLTILDMVKPSGSGKNATLAECARTEFSHLNGNYSTMDVKNTNITSKKITYDWNEYEQSLVLSSYYWIIWATELPGGLLAHHYGAKHVFGLSNFLVGLLTFIVPLSTSFGFKTLIAIRILQGMIAGGAWPSMHTMVAKWIPPNERGKFISSYLGSSVGTAFTYFICGYIIDWYGWEYVFYFTGGLASLWYIAWVFLVYETPQQHPWISEEEKEYIEKSIGDTLEKNKLPIPWKEIFSCRAVWMNLISQWGVTGSVSAMITHMPTYLQFIHGLQIKSIGVWSGLPHITRWMFSFLFGVFSQYQKCMSSSKIRKLATFICSVGVGILTLAAAFSGCNTEIALILLVLTITLQGTFSAGPLATVIDMSPNFSGVLQGIMAGASVTSGFVYPTIVGYLTENNQTSGQWQKYFFIVAALSAITGALDCIFGSSKLQPWNAGPQKVKEMEPLQKKTSQNSA